MVNKKVSETYNMERVEKLLENINCKIKNRNIFTWKVLFGWLICIPVMLIGVGLTGLSDEPIFIVVAYVIAVIWFVINLAIGLVALYKSTKDNNL